MISATENKRTNITKGAPIVLIPQEILRVFGSCEPGNLGEDPTYISYNSLITLIMNTSKPMGKQSKVKGHVGW